MLNAMIVEAAKDNVIVAIEPIAKGDTVTYNCAGQAIVKYGEHIGLAARNIKAGEHVHCHNLEEHRENLDAKG